MSEWAVIYLALAVTLALLGLGVWKFWELAA